MNPNSFGLLVTCLPKRAAPSLQYHASKDKLNHGPSCHPQSLAGASQLDRYDVVLSTGQPRVTTSVRLPRCLLPASPLSTGCTMKNCPRIPGQHERDSAATGLVRLAGQAVRETRRYNVAGVSVHKD